MADFGEAWSEAAPGTAWSPAEVLTNPLAAAANPPDGTKIDWSKAEPLGVLATANAPNALPLSHEVEM
jgi:hypothetical protein